MTRHDDWAAYLDPGQDDPALAGPERAALDEIGAALADEALWEQPPASLRDRILAAAETDRAAEADLGSEPAAEPAFDDRATFGPEPDPNVEPGFEHRATFGPEPEPNAEPGFEDLTGFESMNPPAVVDPRRVNFETAEHPTASLVKARSRWFGPALAGVAAAAVAVIAIVAVPQLLDDEDAGITTFEAAGTPVAPSATARVEVEPLGPGVAITLHITGLPPADPGTYYAGWLNGPEGSVPIGSFHWREGGVPIELWSGVDVERYPRLAVTLQQEGAPTTSSGEAVLTADLTGG